MRNSVKRAVAVSSALALALSASVTSFAATLTEEKSQGTATVITRIEPSYIVTIPDDTVVGFNATTTPFGVVKAEKIQIEPNKTVRISMQAGEMQNSLDLSKTLPYTITNASGVEFNGIDLFKTGDQSDELQINITEEDWNKAYAGSYSAKVVFSLAYLDVVNMR